MDLKRWACGELWESLEWTGVYIPVLNAPLDMNGDGIYDVYFSDVPNYSGEYSSIAVILGSIQTVKKAIDDPNGGYIYWYNNTSKIWNENMYLYPIPQEVINMNSNLTQNPYW